MSIKMGFLVTREERYRIMKLCNECFEIGLVFSIQVYQIALYNLDLYDSFKDITCKEMGTRKQAGESR